MAKHKELDPYQLAVVRFRKGRAVVMAAWGSGKTTTIVSRIKSLLADGVRPERILSSTFTKEGAREMASRVDIKSDHKLFTTFHSWALKFIRHEFENLPYPVRPNPLCLPLDAARMIAKLAKMYDVDWKDAGNFISLMKRRGIDPERAAREAKTDKEDCYVHVYRKYEQELRGKGLLDFDSIVIETANLLEKRPDVAARWQYEYCHPADTMIAESGHYKCGTRSIALDEKPVQNLINGQAILGWDRLRKRIPVRQPKKISVGTRYYNGPMLTIMAAGRGVDVTPQHQFWVRMVNTKGKFFVYLMWKENVGFRVGMVHAKDNTAGGNGLWQRCRGQGADAAWILRLCDTKEDALFWEEFYSLQYQIPEHEFTSGQRIFTAFATEKSGKQLLESLGLLFGCPYYEPNVLAKYGRKPKQAGFFITAAANILPGYMQVPLPEEQSSALIESKSSRMYSGQVYSLNVDELHTYVANGIVVGNCQVDEAQDTDSVQWRIIKAISSQHGNLLAVGDENQGMYSWRGSESYLQSYFLSLFPDAKVFPLPINYRSTGALVSYCKKIAPIRNETVALLSTPNEYGVDPTFRLYLREDEEAKQIITGITDLGSTAILARTNRQLAAFENVCGDMGLRYKLLGKSGFWGQREIRDAVAIVGSIVCPTDANILRMLQARCEATKFIRKTGNREHPSTIDHLKAYQARQLGNAPLNQILAHFDCPDSMQAQYVRGIASTLRALRHETANMSGDMAMQAIDRYFGILSAYDEVSDDEDDKKNFDNEPGQNLLKLFEYASKRGSLQDFYSFTERVRRATLARTNCLTLSTIHQAKGKEWSSVFVAGVNDEVLPHIKGDEAEEYRIYLVACSRAAKLLQVSASGVPSKLIAGEVKQAGANPDPWENWTLGG